MHQSMVGPDDLTRRGKRMRAARRWTLVGMVVVLGVLLARDVSAWGDTGHQIICEIAFQELHPQARAAVTRLLQHEADFMTFATACTWPDHPRKRASEHFVNLPRAAAQLEHNACPSDVPCVVTAIAQDVETLARPSASDPEKLAALKFLGHWVGDVHQPLHVSFQDDKGGNEIDEQAPCAQNLHAVWDTCIIQRKLGTNVPHIATELRAQVTEAERTRWTTTGAKDWANESFAITTAAAVQY